MALLPFRWAETGLLKAINDLAVGKSAKKAIQATVKKMTLRAVKIAKFKTPVDSGRAIRGWKMKLEKDGTVGVFFNDVPYVNVLEFGGYPVTALGRRGTLRPGAFIRGKAQLGGHAPGKRTQRPPGGKPDMRANVSKQSPRGMVRSTIIDIEPAFLFELNKALDLALNAT